MFQRQRIYELIVGDNRTKDAVVINDLHITFDINKHSDNKKTNNSARIEVYNLPSKVLNALQEDFAVCSLSAGYEDTGLTLLIVGQVVDISTRMSGTDRVTQFVIGEGYIELTRAYLSSITPAGYTVEQTIEEIRKQMPGVARGAYTGLNIKNRILYGYPLTGTPREMLNELAEAYNIEWRLDRNSLSVTDDKGITERNLNTGFVLNEDTGLLEIPFYTSADGNRSSKDKKRRKGVQFKALLNGQIFPGSIVRIESPLITGWYKITSANYRGQYEGNDWYIECFSDEILKEDIPT